MKEKKARVEDALHATRAAVEEGIVPGGGVALIRALPSLDSAQVRATIGSTASTSSAAPLEEPLRQIAANAGVDGSIVVDKVEERQGRASASTPRTDEYEDLVEGRRHRPDQGRARGAAERGVGRVASC